MKIYNLVGYIKRDDVNYCFLIPIYKRDNKFFFHKLSEDSQRIVDFTPYLAENYEHDDNFKPISNYSHLESRRSFMFRKTSDLRRKLDDPPIFVFKFFKKTNFGTPDDYSFRFFLAKCLVDPEFKNNFLRKEVYKIFSGFEDFELLVEKAKEGNKKSIIYLKAVAIHSESEGIVYTKDFVSVVKENKKMAALRLRKDTQGNKAKKDPHSRRSETAHQNIMTSEKMKNLFKR